MIVTIFDTETTGFPTDDFSPEIVQIAAIMQDTETRRVLGEINLIVTPKGIIPDEVANIHGITTTIAGEFGINQVTAESLFCWMVQSADVLVAHNIEFDMEMLELNWKIAYGVAKGIQQYDTMNESRLIIDLPPGTYHGTYTEGPKPPKLREAYEFFMDKPLENAHDAMADTRACRDIYFAIQDHQA